MTSMKGWIDEVRVVPLTDVSVELGLQCYHGMLGPCPSCQAHKRGRHDSRLPAGMTRDTKGWHCHRCKASGDGLDLVAFSLYGAKLRELSSCQIKTVAQWFADRGWCQIENYTPKTNTPKPCFRPQVPITSKQDEVLPRPPKSEILAVWESCIKVCKDSEVSAWLESKGIEPTRVEERDLARALPKNATMPPWAKLKGRNWTYGWRCLLPA